MLKKGYFAISLYPNLQIYHTKKDYNLKNSEIYYNSTLSLPIFYNLKNFEINYIVKQLYNFFKLYA